MEQILCCHKMDRTSRSPCVNPQAICRCLWFMGLFLTDCLCFQRCPVAPRRSTTVATPFSTASSAPCSTRGSTRPSCSSSTAARRRVHKSSAGAPVMSRSLLRGCLVITGRAVGLPPPRLHPLARSQLRACRWRPRVWLLQ